jgi:hypothetical protein
MAKEELKLKTPGWISFIIACIILILGHLIFTGSVPGATGALRWWNVLILLLLWGAVSAGLEAFVSRKK